MRSRMCLPPACRAGGRRGIGQHDSPVASKDGQTTAAGAVTSHGWPSRRERLCKRGGALSAMVGRGGYPPQHQHQLRSVGDILGRATRCDFKCEGNAPPSVTPSFLLQPNCVRSSAGRCGFEVYWCDGFARREGSVEVDRGVEGRRRGGIKSLARLRGGPNFPVEGRREL